jgi:hypothetical protein
VCDTRRVAPQTHAGVQSTARCSPPHGPATTRAALQKEGHLVSRLGTAVVSIAFARCQLA